VVSLSIRILLPRKKLRSHSNWRLDG
jgi:hypothetical protein